MLNALRHQRYFHSADSFISADVFCAQRLAASEVLSYQDFICFHWYSHVLNALRHQRYFHALNEAAADIENLCSTPCGIRGTFIASPLCVARPLCVVLNALRHQRYFHAALIALSAAAKISGAQRLAASEVLSFESVIISVKAGQCSTPCGIRGTFIVIPLCQLPSQVKCSTPCGIRGTFITANGSRSRRLITCSTPCGIRGTFILPPNHEIGEFIGCAQRLAASEVLSWRLS